MLQKSIGMSLTPPAHAFHTNPIPLCFNNFEVKRAFLHTHHTHHTHHTLCAHLFFLNNRSFYHAGS